MKINRSFSAPQLSSPRKAIITSAFSEIKKSASSQFLSEFSQMSVDDLEIDVSEMGDDLKEVVQGGIEYMERKSIFSPIYLLIRIITRLIVAGFVHFVHHLIAIMYHLMDSIINHVHTPPF